MAINYGMDSAKFNGKAGEIRENRQKVPTFFPFDLPDQLSFSNRLVSLITEAEKGLSELSGAGKILSTGNLIPQPIWLISPHLRQEAIASSRIEGTRISLPEVLEFESGIPSSKKQEGGQEILDFIRAMDYGIEETAKTGISIELIKKIHRTMFAGKGRSGSFRTEQNWIGATHRVEDAKFIPAAPEEVESLMQGFEEYVSQEHNLPPIIQAGLMHYQFEAIHPFEDGNGRVGRSLILLHLLQKDILSIPLLSLSPFFEKYEPEYKERLYLVSQNGDYEKWLEFFLAAVSNQSKAALNSTIELVNLRNTYQERLNTKRAPAITYRLIDLFFRYPYLTIPLAREKLNVHYQTIQRAIKYLELEGIAKEITGKKRHTSYSAIEIMKIIENT